MIDIIILVLLVLGFLVGIKRGFVMQIMRLVGTVTSYVVAFVYAKKLGPHLELWVPFPQMGSDTFLEEYIQNETLEQSFYYVIAFIILFVISKIVLFYIGSLLDFITRIPILKQINSLFGGAFGVLEIYLVVFVVLLIATKLPVESVQNHLDNSVLTGIIVDHTPYISEKIKTLWV